VPFLRYTRDRRGYETTYLMHGYRSAQGPGRTRVLYLFRSPAHVKVGRRALDDEAREALEHTHPDLSFDWSALGREPAPHHFEDRDRSARHDRPRGPAPRVPPPAPPAAIDDQTILGRTLGSAEAGRLRARYGELVRRIARRAASPEDRDRLTERAQRLNPDDWPDEAAVRAGIGVVESEWEAIAGELPQRRRGRRGGRARGGGEGGPGAVETAGAPAEASGIISGEGNPDEPVLEEVEAGFVGHDDGVRGPGDGDHLGADTAAARDPVDGADGSGLPGRDGDHLD
jgi:hypothetical protein